MRIGPLREEPAEGGRRRTSATITWEDEPRPPFEMYFERLESPEKSAGDSHPFLLASLVSAWRRGERRVLVDGSICPRLRDGLRAALALIARWWETDRVALVIEATGGFHPYPERRERSALFLTGGVDSLHMLQQNLLGYPRDHPGAFRDAVYVAHLSFLEYAHERSARTLNLAARQTGIVRAIAGACGLEPVFLESNFRLLEPENYLVLPQDQGSQLAAAGHALLPRIGSVSVAASHDARFLPRWGTHPLLDPHYGSSGLEIRHEGLGFTRFEKVADLASWKVARENLLVCVEGPLEPGRLNCGECEKCLRTMTALRAVGALDAAASFAGNDVTPEKIDRMPFGELAFFDWLWRPMLDPLRRRGDHAIARAVARKLAAARGLEDWLAERDWRGRLRRLDRRALGGAVLRVSRKLRGLPGPRPA
jgi:hypothetical protein